LPQGFEVHYQPQVTLDTRPITEMETLVRWGLPRRGLVMPSEFIQVTEETGLIVSIGERVLEEACRQATEWGNQNGHSTTITTCVNFSMRQLQGPDLGDKIERALRRAALDSNKLNLEITETMVIEDEHHVIGVLRDQSAFRVRIALDDFGSGFSSLNYVKDLPVDDAIVRLSVDLAHTGSRGHRRGSGERPASGELDGHDVRSGPRVSISRNHYPARQRRSS
jgi:EAL domain-containing protein (putative c-di-GMP-specific phosphodiesterase class I)